MTKTMLIFEFPWDGSLAWIFSPFKYINPQNDKCSFIAKEKKNLIEYYYFCSKSIPKISHTNFKKNLILRKTVPVNVILI